MKLLSGMLAGMALLASDAFADSDREQIKTAMECFYEWDLYGGEERASACIADSVLYHRVDENGEHSYGTPPLATSEGKGADAVIHHLLDIDIYNDVAVVTSLHRYQPDAPENNYIKNIVLHKLSQGWRITNVVWGRVTNDQ